MKLSAFASKYFEMDEDELKESLIENGFFKTNGTPKVKYINDEMFDQNGNVLDVSGLRESLEEIFDSEDEDDESETEDEDDSDDESDEDDEDLDDLDFDTLKNTVEDFEFDDKDSIADMCHMLVDKLKDFEDDEEDDDDDFTKVDGSKLVKSSRSKKNEIEDNDEEEDDDEDPNAPGNYRGWKISKEGIKIIAKKGRKVLTTSFKGNIRKIIDKEED